MLDLALVLFGTNASAISNANPSPQLMETKRSNATDEVPRNSLRCYFGFSDVD